jgi:hypothetical protein
VFDINEVEKAAQDEIRKEKIEKAKKALMAQMRIVENAKQVLRGEELKLADIKAQIGDGTL